MTGRVLALSSALLALAFGLGCSTSQQLESISVSPATATLALAGQTAQFQATGAYVNGKKGTESMQNLTNQVTWTSSVTSVATINSSGLATATGFGTSTITATGGNGGITGTATLTVQPVAGGDLESLTIMRGNQFFHRAGETTQFIAIGNYSTQPVARDLTGQVKWSSKDEGVATVTSAGIATATGNCDSEQATTITAVARDSAGNEITGAASLSTGSCLAGDVPSLNVYKLGQGSGTVTSTAATLNCSGAICTANFALNSQVTLTATPAPGSYFVGWSANCKSEQGSACTVTMLHNETVGAIFSPEQ